MTPPIDNTRALRATTRGVIYVHDAAKAFCRPIEWAIADVLGYEPTFDWTAQPIAPSRMRTEVSWTGLVGLAAHLVVALKQLPDLRFEVTEEPALDSEGERYAHTPSLGVYRAHMGRHGDVLVHEQRIRTLLEESVDLTSLRNGLALVLGTAWDAELEPFRVAGEGTPVRWLHRVG